MGETRKIGEVGASEVGQQNADQFGDEALLADANSRVVEVAHFREYGGEHGL